MRRRDRDCVAGERSLCTLPALHSELTVDQVLPETELAVEPELSCRRDTGGGS